MGFNEFPSPLALYFVVSISLYTCLAFKLFDSSLLLFHSCTTEKRTIGALSIFLAWMALVLFIRKFPKLGIYVVMFTSILYTFFKFFIIYVLFLVAFALSFYTLLHDPQVRFILLYYKSLRPEFYSNLTNRTLPQVDNNTLNWISSMPFHRWTPPIGESFPL